MSHTPGPWAVIANADLPDKMQVIHVADVQANARLIAAAPDLLEALKACVPTLNSVLEGTAPAGDCNTLDARIQACEAIAKATSSSSARSPKA